MRGQFIQRKKNPTEKECDFPKVMLNEERFVKRLYLILGTTFSRKQVSHRELR